MKYDERIRTAWAAREKRLLAETGWLTVVGRHPLDPGPNELPFGIVMLEGSTVRFGDRVLRPDTPDDGIVHENRIYELVLRGGIYSIRVRDPNSALRRDFAGIDRYPIDERWSVTGRIERYDPPTVLEVPHALGGTDTYPCPGAIVFRVDGRPHRLEPGRLNDGRFFVVFADETNRDETYGAGRFLYAPPPEGDDVILDFNLAMNPPCAFTPYVSCPLPPEQNRLALRATAGEKRPRDGP